MAANLIWYGDKVFKIVETAVTTGLTEWAMTTEAHAKGSVYPGRGVVTGTYRRSIHTAAPTYNYGSDDVKPSAGSPERSGRGGSAARYGDKIGIVLGSGMKYASKLEDLYSVIGGAVNSKAGELPGVLRKHAIRNGLKPG